MLEGAHLVLAQSIPIDPGVLLTQGPLGVVAGILVWQLARLQDKMDKMIEAHKLEIAAERALNARLQDQRLEDHKVLIPLAHSMVVSTEQTNELVKRSMDR